VWPALNPTSFWLWLFLILSGRVQKTELCGGFAAGFLVDVFTGGYLGLNALALAAAGYLAGEAKTGLYLNSNARVATVTLAVSLAAGVLQYLLLAFSGVFVSPWPALGIIFPGAVYNTVVALLIKLFYHPRLLFD